MWGRRREKKFKEEKVRIGGRPWRGGKKELRPLEFKLFPESKVYHVVNLKSEGTTDASNCAQN